jgi:hypothetical protein
MKEAGSMPGHMMRYGSQFSPKALRWPIASGVREVVYRRSLPLATTHLRIGLSMAGDQAAILGASQMVTQYVLSPAVIEATLQATG